MRSAIQVVCLAILGVVLGRFDSVELRTCGAPCRWACLRASRVSSPSGFEVLLSTARMVVASEELRSCFLAWSCAW